MIFFRRRLGWLLHLPSREIVLLAGVLIVVLLTYLFIKLTDEMKEGETQKFDEWVLRSLRRGDDPRTPIGPAWLRESALDVTALGSPVVLILVVSAVAGFLVLQRRFGLLWLTLAATGGGALLGYVLKEIINRGRPTVVPHLREVNTPSFPSGHAMLSAIVYLTLGIMLMQIVRGRLTRLYCLLWALFLTLLTGLSRIYLGVHYPTDVLAGWSAGLVWALLCWIVAKYLQREGAIEQPTGDR